MADLVVPQLGESISEAVVSKWLKNVGDAVTVDEPIAELETDKITVQLPSPVAGALSEQRFAVGATVKVGDVIGAVEAGKQGKSVAPPAKAVPPPREVVQAQPAPPPVAAAPVTPTGPPAPPPVVATAAAAAAPKTNGKSEAIASPALVGGAAPPNGGAGSINRDALLKLTPSQRLTARETGVLPAPGVAVQSGPSAEDRLGQIDPRDEVIAMSPLRKRVAERLVQAQHESAHLTTFNEVDMTAIMALRAKYKDSFEKSHGVKLGFMSFFVKASVAAAKLFPGINAELIGGNIVYKKHYDFGRASASSPTNRATASSRSPTSKAARSRSRTAASTAR